MSQSPEDGVWDLHVLVKVCAATQYIVMTELLQHVVEDHC